MMLKWICAITSTLVCVGAPLSHAQDPKGTVVKLDELQSRAPGDWKAEKPANRLRSHQFRLSKAKGDKEEAELAILPNVTGTPEKNIQRWKEMFVPPENKSIEDVSRVDTFKVGTAKVIYLDVSGTYLYKDRPFAPDSKAVPRPGYRMFSVIFDTGDGSHLVRLVGPEQTLKQHKKAFDDWLKSFRK
jgi:hypothetical protein